MYFALFLFLLRADDCLGFMVGSTYSSVIPDTVKESTEKTYSNSSTKEETAKDDTHSEVTLTYAASTINFNRSKSSENSKYLAQTSGAAFESTLFFYFLNFSACSYGNGEWVLDDSRPLYSGFGCKRWLSATWACRLTERTDFSYERYRWVPKDCELPAFERSEFLKRYLTSLLFLAYCKLESFLHFPRGK